MQELSKALVDFGCVFKCIHSVYVEGLQHHILIRFARSDYLVILREHNVRAGGDVVV